MTRPVLITGGGSIGPLGTGVDALVEGVVAGRTALERSGRICVARVRETAGPGPFHPNVWRRLDRCSRLAATAALEALERAGLPAGAAGTVGLVTGTMTAGVASLHAFLTTLFEEGPGSVSPLLLPITVPNAPASQCSLLLGLRGPSLTVSQMEASGLAAIATAAGLLRDGVCDVVLAGGADERVPEFEDAWDRLHLLFRGEPEDFPGPFGRGRRGFVPGEGASFVVLESSEAAARRGAAAWAEVLGEAMTHAPGPVHRWPADSGSAAAIGAAMAQARLGPEEIGAVVAGANGSQVLDAVETRAILAALGPAARRIPVTSVKGGTGESGSASACALLLAACSVRDGFVPPVAGLVEPDAGLGLNVVIGKTRRGPLPSVLVSALGTGGSCAAVVLGRPGV
jgi:3-oxoacyl-[acyl-carrier-protein] synthase II